ncbi:uncharacterized protein CDAR_622041 [Caerostris darwini]|uniref:Uncharacterized protein n=1 Tax=Caerostris darwini TaxID=1538125 RepID=A0AAV4UDT1_9ARAC|nr:uncharacterized protein CDAR_622041 [Caerostris darwini]
MWTLDPDLLIHLLGKLKLDSIPEDISDTLSSIENRTEENICNRGFEAQNLAIDPVIENLQKQCHSKGTKQSIPLYKMSLPLLNQQRKLNDSESIKSGLQRLPFLPYEEISGDGSDKSIHNDDTYIQEYGNTNSLFSEPSTSSLNRTVCIQENDSNDSTYDSLGFSKQNCNSLTKSISSQDSGYDTSSTISPSPPFLSTETFNSDDFCHDEVDEQLESLLAGLVEVENSLLLPISPTNNSKVPVLKNAINPEDHKEKIVNFLKESPSIDSVQVSVILSNENSNTSETVENISEKDDENSVDTSTCRKSPYSSKKSSFKAKDRILGYEFKYASKDDDGQIFIYKKGSINEKNKILKQIQDNERVHKIKLIRLLGRSLKRANDDDRENVKRRRLLSSKTSNKGTQLKDSCL